MKKMIFIGLIVCLFVGCSQPTTKTIEGQTVCLTEKYGVSFADCGSGRYIFCVNKSIVVEEVTTVIIRLISAQEMFEKEHPDLEYVGGYSVGQLGTYLVATYRPKGSPTSN
ncbi:MAG: hypothetical protein LBU27_00475 [Candidatus Peribacteria bacterium]|jgi:hypothetical protein|nr:hypothetical protein [Candidatus Peribacteria bacterium]